MVNESIKIRIKTIFILFNVILIDHSSSIISIFIIRTEFSLIFKEFCYLGLLYHDVLLSALAAFVSCIWGVWAYWSAGLSLFEPSWSRNWNSVFAFIDWHCWFKLLWFILLRHLLVFSFFFVIINFSINIVIDEVFLIVPDLALFCLFSDIWCSINLLTILTEILTVIFRFVFCMKKDFFAIDSDSRILLLFLCRIQWL